MTESSCCLCRELGKFSESKFFCIECQQSLCVTCADIHRVSKPSRDHNVVERTDKLSENKAGKDILLMLSRYVTCSEHEGKQLEFYCKIHDTFLCFTCYLSKHKNCNIVTEIKKEHHASKTTTKRKIGFLKDEHLKLSEFVKAVTETCQESKDIEQNQTTAISARLQEIRSTLVRLMDNLEDNIVHKSKRIMEQNQFQRSELTDILEKTLTQVNHNMSLIRKLPEIGSDGQISIALHKLKQEFQCLENSIMEVLHSHKTNECVLKESDLLSTILAIGVNETDRLVDVDSKGSSLQLPRHKVLSGCTVEKLKMKTIKELCTAHYGPLYNCLLYVSKKSLFLVDSRFGQCYLSNQRYRVIASCNFMPNTTSEVDFERTPFSATNLQDGVVAVSVPEEKKIYVLNAENLTKLSHINTKYKPRAIHGLSNGDIAIAWDEPVAFGIISSPEKISRWQLPDRIKIDEIVYFTQDRNGRSLKQFDFMAVDERWSHVIQPCKDESAVYCFDFEGNPKFCYKNSGLIWPNGVAIDKNSYIYICEERNSGIHVISPNGVTMNIVKDGCPVAPLAVGFDKRGKKFAVSNSGLGYAGRDIAIYGTAKK